MRKQCAKRCPRCGNRPIFSPRQVLNVQLTRAHCSCVATAPLEAFAESRRRCVLMWNRVVDLARAGDPFDKPRAGRRTAKNVPVGDLGKVKA